MRDTVLFYRSHIDALRNLPPDQFKASMLAISDYVLDDKMPVDDPVATAMLMMAKPVVDAYKVHYENGKKGGRPKKNLDEAEKNQNKPNSDQVSLGYENQNLTITLKDKGLKDKGERIKEKGQKIDAQRTEDKCLPSISNEIDSTVDTVTAEWNKLEECGITPIKAVRSGSKRYNSLMARVKQYGLDEVIAAIRNIEDSRFLRGDNRNGWAITFDWFVLPNNFQKVYEGNYTDRNRSQSSRFDVVDEWARGE